MQRTDKALLCLALFLGAVAFSVQACSADNNDPVYSPKYSVDLSWGYLGGTLKYTDSAGNISVNAYSASGGNTQIGGSAYFPVTFISEYYASNLYIEAGGVYGMPQDGLSASYLHLDLIGTNDTDFACPAYAGMGINYSIWSQGMMGGFGFDIVGGIAPTESISVGLKALSLAGSLNKNNFNISYALWEVCGDVKYSF